MEITQLREIVEHDTKSALAQVAQTEGQLREAAKGPSELAPFKGLTLAEWEAVKRGERVENHERMQRDKEEALAKMSEQKDLGLITTVSEIRKTLEEGFFEDHMTPGQFLFMWIATEESQKNGPWVKNGTCPCFDPNYAKHVLFRAIADARGVSYMEVRASIKVDEEVPSWM